jgi:hypothetical protein
MGHCLNCNKEIQEYTGRRPKVYCSDACRQKFFQAKNKAKAAEKKEKGTPTPETKTAASNGAKKSLLVRGYQWYVKQIQELMFEDEYMTMDEMIQSDENLTTAEREKLLLGMKNRQSS